MYTVHFGNYVFEMMPNGYVIIDEKYIEIDIKANDIKLDEVEAVILDPNNLKVIELYYDDHLISRFTKYNYYERILKIPHQMITEHDKEGNSIESEVDIIKVTIRTVRPQDLMKQIQATMEYMAIMTDVDIDEEI